MKTAIYIEDGTVQVVITPETSFEKSVISELKGKSVSVKIFHGSFYDCRGGWIRQSSHSVLNQSYQSGEATDQSLILRVVEDDDEEEDGTKVSS